jgi:hypothetical protein
MATQESPNSEALRMLLAQAINAGGIPESYDGEVWDTEKLQQDFEVQGFAAPFVVVRRKSDGQRGTLTFVHAPRVYFNFVPVS